MWSLIKFFFGYWTFLGGLFVGYFPGRIIGLLIGGVVGKTSSNSMPSGPRSTNVPQRGGKSISTLSTSDSETDDFYESNDDEFESDDPITCYDDTEIQNATYLLDGSNILHWEEETRGISLDILCSITDYLKQNRKDFFVLFDATAPYRLKENNNADLNRLNALLKTDPSHFRIIPGGTRADEYLLEEARRDPNAIILTNDRYRDHFEDYPDVLSAERRCVQHGMIMKNGDICFLGINLSIPIRRDESVYSKNNGAVKNNHSKTKKTKVPEKEICQFCGAKLKPNASFCSQCGGKVMKH